MLDTILAILKVTNTFSPLGVAVVCLLILGLVLYAVFYQNGPIQILANNHLVHVQDTLDTIAKNGDKQLEHLEEISKDISFIKGKISR